MAILSNQLEKKNVRMQFGNLIYSRGLAFAECDEAHFWLNGYVNKQNCRIWSEANPHVYVETPLHPEKLTVWCALWAGGIIGPYFFKNDEGYNVTVNGDRPVNWPPRSCDLTPLDYFLWGYVKSLVYADKPQTLDHLEDNIRRAIADIRTQMLEKVIENWTSRLDYIRDICGSHMPEIIFKMEDVGIFISRVKTAATRLQEAGHKLDDLYIGFQLIRWLPQEFQSTVQQIYRWKEEDFRVVKIEAELILEANRLQLMKQDLEKAENAYLSSFTSKKSKTLPGATAAVHGDPNGKNDYQKKGGKVFNCKTIKNVKQSNKTIGPCYVCNKYGHLKVNCKEKKSLQKSPSTVNETFNTEFNINLRFCEAECSLLELDKQLVTSCILFEENSDKGVWVIDTAATSHFCNDKSLFLDLKPITNMKMSLATEDKSCPVEGIGTLRFRVKYKGSFHEITLTDVLFNPKLRRNLLSGSRLESKGAHFVGTKDGIKTLLKSSEVPHKFWGEALLCFTYAWNRICHKDSNKTPFEKYSGRKPSVLHLKPFGCLAYAGVPKQIRKKFDMRAKM
ncbi:retrovirus-related Pol polyprotein from transposon RE1 [Trichonephila clavipes]|nr:retrovirus-related Pol polyprotein from transposon RE1 [Trichonephila clavipes]